MHKKMHSQAFLISVFPEGIWVKLDEAGRDRGGSANMFTSTEGTRPAVANIMHGMNVEVTCFS